MTIKCAGCGQFLGFAELAFSEHHFEPLSEFGPEVSEWLGPCCRYRDRDGARSAETACPAPVPKDRQARAREGIAPKSLEGHS